MVCFGLQGFIIVKLGSVTLETCDTLIIRYEASPRGVCTVRSNNGTGLSSRVLRYSPGTTITRAPLSHFIHLSPTPYQLSDRQRP